MYTTVDAIPSESVPTSYVNRPFKAPCSSHPNTFPCPDDPSTCCASVYRCTDPNAQISEQDWQCYTCPNGLNFDTVSGKCTNGPVPITPTPTPTPTTTTLGGTTINNNTPTTKTTTTTTTTTSNKSTWLSPFFITFLITTILSLIFGTVFIYYGNGWAAGGILLAYLFINSSIAYYFGLS
jgi:hypothetical protein